MVVFHNKNDQHVRPASQMEEWFVYFRTSNFFIYSIILFISGWIIWNYIPGLPHFDSTEDFGHLNLLLSLEASIATVLLMRDNARSRVREMKILESIQMSIAKLSNIERDIDEIQEDVVELQDGVEELADAAD